MTQPPTDSRPEEVRLNEQVRACRDCSFMWPQDPASSPGKGQYGLVPVTKDWKRPTQARSWSGAIEPGFPDPAVLMGCRKAPIMTIGINPNLQSFFNVPRYLPSKPGSYFSEMVRSVYPAFSSDADYAQHYRHFHRDEHQLQMSESDWVACQAEKIIAPFDATVCGERDPAGRQLRYFLRPESSADQTDQSIHVTWGARENFSVFRARAKQGEAFAGKTNAASLTGKQVTLDSRDMSYHVRIQKLFEQLSLVPGEDVSMHDMIACATPGWKSEYDIDRNELKANCQTKKENHYLQRQVLHSRPALICFSGKEPYQVFVDMFKPFISGEPEVIEWNNDVFKLMQLAADKPVVLRMPLTEDPDDPMWECRLFPMPHFSYANNYEPHVRLQRSEWVALNKMVPGLEKALIDQDDTRPVDEQVFSVSAAPARPCPFPGAAPWEKPIQLTERVYTIRMEKDQRLATVCGLAPDEPEAFSPADSFVKDRWVDPAQLLRQVFDERVAAGQLMAQITPPIEPGAGALQRSGGGCSYCTHYQLSGGCPYPSVPRSTAMDSASIANTLHTFNTQKGI